MNMKRKLTALLLLLALLLSLTACGDAAQTIDTVQQAAQTVQEIAAAQEEETPAIEEDGTYTTKEDVVRYIHTYGHLPENFITKKQAQALGWEGGSVEVYQEGAAIGGDRFGNREGLLPEQTGRSYTECDINTDGADSRGAERLIFSNDGLYFYTSDHYVSFTELTVDGGTVVWSR